MAVDVTVVGGGISGLACARAATAAGLSVRVLDRGRRVGGRLASRTLWGRPVDHGASYFVVGDSAPFEAVVAGWQERGLARPWTDTFVVIGADGSQTQKPGPIRWAAPRGLRSLAADLADGLDVHLDRTIERVEPYRVDWQDAGEVVLAMPGPQAARLTGAAPGADLEWEPVIAVALRWDRRQWPGDLHGAFVDEHPDVSFIADDGDRRGDAAPVLVVHTTAQRARQHLDEPATAVPAVVAATRHLLGIHTEPEETFAHRWRFARPAQTAGASYFRGPGLSACGDAWGDSPAVRTAWSSGHALGLALAAA
ncbi:NAD(P)-binding protein [Microbacterium sp. UBA3394]|uniref:NAD(P)/FAD-dependent oxidoreductase n=1 Tax=Microbacterium sp. UBA3394 TaxID=1946945 RepID=UPI000C5CD3B6|nr:NAD(P)-binding protein [Microbacterium sp. UBA3394]MAM53289.1 NAD/FAD-dependent oxidoreductase [Microbacterium sp.]MAU94309.1 NAD/FAD-dependent oxidoreductase [Fulvimarina sp.]|tara:strand:- start:816 stop:1745 length:930 start_codon:yes stop_codon:yes gene_type:complete